MTRLPEGKTRLDLVKEAAGTGEPDLRKRGRLVVGIDKLVEDSHNERKTFRNMDGLIASVRSVGLVEPITVTPVEGVSGRYQIVTGHRRFRAARAAGLSQVEVLIREPEAARDRRLKSIISNVQREDVGPVELAEALRSLLDEDPRIRQQDDLANLIGKPKSWVSSMLRILDLPVDLRERVSTSKLSLSYGSVADVARVGDPAQQGELVDALLGGATVRDLRDRIDVIQGKPRRTGRGDDRSEMVETTPKPKRVFYTPHGASVIVQATGKSLPLRHVLDALQDALDQARRQVDND